MLEKVMDKDTLFKIMSVYGVESVLICNPEIQFRIGHYSDDCMYDFDIKFICDYLDPGVKDIEGYRFVNNRWIRDDNVVYDRVKISIRLLDRLFKFMKQGHRVDYSVFYFFLVNYLKYRKPICLCFDRTCPCSEYIMFGKCDCGLFK